ncbi:hypothetical protein F3Y22_tig00110546pilonHSYRG00073 [Hibiscus syriacus]|uniref:Uncharacterized protein n=1 Tax=Hibiscus syriacus TaxID=106335 RepID=A0A6A3AAV1_HIBSY|nr:hypothetical protein F3Y22_tig00110546pilonHSYRG00073 [Hibiscus syriacus]
MTAHPSAGTETVFLSERLADVSGLTNFTGGFTGKSGVNTPGIPYCYSNRWIVLEVNTIAPNYVHPKLERTAPGRKRRYNCFGCIALSGRVVFKNGCSGSFAKGCVLCTLVGSGCNVVSTRCWSAVMRTSVVWAGPSMITEVVKGLI